MSFNSSMLVFLSAEIGMNSGMYFFNSSMYASSTKSTLFNRINIGTYDLLRSNTSMNWSMVTSSLKSTSALMYPYSFRIERIVFSSKWVSLQVEDTLTPPSFFLFTVTSGGLSFGLIPIALNSFKITSICCGLNVSSTTRIKSAVLATDRISLPLPLPLLAPVMIPGMSKIWIFAFLCSITPGTISKVVN